MIISKIIAKIIISISHHAKLPLFSYVNSYSWLNPAANSKFTVSFNLTNTLYLSPSFSCDALTGFPDISVYTYSTTSL